MLALCLMLLGTYYAQNYAGIIGWCLAMKHKESYKFYHIISRYFGKFVLEGVNRN